MASLKNRFILVILSILFFTTCGSGGSSNGGGGSGGSSCSGCPSAPSVITATWYYSCSCHYIQWTNVLDATDYNIYWSTTSGVNKSNGTKIAWIRANSGSTTYYNHGNLTAGTTYYYVVTAINSYGESGESSQVSSTALGTPAITSVSPTSGPAGTQITITGTNFSPTASNNTVRFYNSCNGNTDVTPLSSTSTQIVTTAPSLPAGCAGYSYYILVSVWSGILSNSSGFSSVSANTIFTVQ